MEVVVIGDYLGVFKRSSPRSEVVDDKQTDLYGLYVHIAHRFALSRSCVFGFLTPFDSRNKQIAAFVLFARVHGEEVAVERERVVGGDNSVVNAALGLVGVTVRMVVYRRAVGIFLVGGKFCRYVAVQVDNVHGRVVKILFESVVVIDVDSVVELELNPDGIVGCIFVLFSCQIFGSD